MKKCEWCGKEFEISDAEDDFDREIGFFNYRNIKKCLCGSCAIDVFNEQVDGVYFETCELCGKEFDYILDSHEFENATDTYLTDLWDSQILCCDCALSKLK